MFTEFSLGRTLGQPCDAAGQMAVLEVTLKALETIRTPGQIVHLPFEWPGDPRGEGITAVLMPEDNAVSSPVHLRRRELSQPDQS